MTASAVVWSFGVVAAFADAILIEFASERGAVKPHRPGGRRALVVERVHYGCQQRRLHLFQETFVDRPHGVGIVEQPVDAILDGMRQGQFVVRAGQPRAWRGDGSDAGRCSGKIRPLRATTRACSTALRSSRTLPYHGRDCSSLSVPLGEVDIGGELSSEMSGQQRNVVAPLAERWHADIERAQAEE